MNKINNTSTINELSIQMAKIGEKVDRVILDVQGINKKLDADYASKEWVQSRYDSTKNIVNGILVTFGLAIVSAIAAFVINGGLK